VILGSQVAEDLFGGFDPVGQKIKVAQMDGGAKKSMTVVGVLAEQGGSMISNPDDAVFVPISTAQYKLFDGRNVLGEPTVSRISVVASSEDAVDSVEAQITSVLTMRHELGADESADFTVMSQAEMLDMADEVSGTLTMFLGAIAGISLVVGGIGIMNIMLVSVTERTREVGLRKAVGARRADILSQFMMEAIVLSVLGGIIGVLTGLGVAKLVDVLGLMRAVPSPLAAVLALGAALAVGVFFGIYPANRAAALSPIEALRYE
jgi:putative ABC transport system permease protein